ncbi:MAG: RDD family protein [Bacteroidota bacterium]
MSRDPREYITPTAFQISPDLMGCELASPKRRLAAFLLDLLFAAMVADLGGVYLVSGIAALLVYRGFRPPSSGKRSVGRYILAFIGGMFLVAAAISAIDGCTSSSDDNDDVEVPAEADTLSRADSLAIAEGLEELNETIAAIGADAFIPSSVQEAINELARAAPEATTDSAAFAQASVVLNQYARAYAQRDTLALDSLQSRAVRLVAGERIDALREENDALDDENDDLDDRIEELEEQLESPSFRYLVTSFANDVGLTFGWVGAYFTLFIFFFAGYTPAKRILGIRVYRLDGKRLTLWHGFERFGGYAAGVVTGLLGFAQVYWDANRQCVHDKIAGTVVVRMNGKTPRLHPEAPAEEPQAEPPTAGAAASDPEEATSTVDAEPAPSGAAPGDTAEKGELPKE